MWSARVLIFYAMTLVWGGMAYGPSPSARAAASPPVASPPAVKPTVATAAPAAGELLSDVPPRLRERLEGMDRELARVHTLAAHFTKRRTTVLLRHPLITRGTVRVADGDVRWDTTRPHASHTLITADQVRILYPEDKRLVVYPLGRRFAQLGLGPMPRMSELARRFAIGQSTPATAAEMIGLKRGEPPPPGLLPLTLTPRKKSMREHVKRLVLVIDTRGPSPRALRIIQADDTRTTYRFTHVKLNPKIDKADLALHPPPGTAVVRHGSAKNQRGQSRGEGRGGRHANQ